MKIRLIYVSLLCLSGLFFGVESIACPNEKHESKSTQGEASEARDIHLALDKDVKDIKSSGINYEKGKNHFPTIKDKKPFPPEYALPPAQNNEQYLRHKEPSKSEYEKNRLLRIEDRQNTKDLVQKEINRQNALAGAIKRFKANRGPDYK